MNEWLNMYEYVYPKGISIIMLCYAIILRYAMLKNNNQFPSKLWNILKK